MLVRRMAGQAIVELAVILPLLVFLVLGGMDLARAWALRADLEDATTSAARWAAIHADDGNLAYAVRGIVRAEVPGATTTTQAGGGADRWVRVTAAVEFRPATPLLPSFQLTSTRTVPVAGTYVPTEGS